MDKRTLMAVALAILVMTSYSFFMQKYYPAPKSNPQEKSQPQLNQDVAKETTQIPAKIGQVKFPNQEVIKLSSDNIEYGLSNIGGCVKYINLKKYNNLEKNEIIYEADSPASAIFSLSGDPATEDFIGGKYRYEKTEKGAKFSIILKNGVEIEKIYKINNSNGLDLELKIKNTIGTPINFGYDIIGVSSMKVMDAQDARFVEPSVYLNGKRVKMRVPRTLDSTWNVYSGDIEWVALQGKYFYLVNKAYQKTVSSTVSKQQNNNICVYLKNDTVKIMPGEAISNKFLLYSGPADYGMMASYNVGIEKSINLGTFEAISKALLWLLDVFYKISGNYGVAIILLASLVFIILYPLTLKSFKSMKEMQILQPKIDRLRKDHKDNPQKLNKEIMELYKKHKVNPFGGCLPMLLQMPIFIALYQAFSRAIELSGAKFLWIKDLSQPDKAFLIPTGGGAAFSVNILPIFMAVMMFFQQRLSTKTSYMASTDKADVLQQQQKMMGVLMPFLFGFIFYNMPSGLVMYWFVNTVLMFFQQKRIMKDSHAAMPIDA